MEKTDLERFDELFKSVGVSLAREADKESTDIELSTYECTDENNMHNIGYSGFGFSFRFNSNGKLIGMGAWE